MRGRTRVLGKSSASPVTTEPRRQDLGVSGSHLRRGWTGFAIIVNRQTRLRVALNRCACVGVALLQIGKRPTPTVSIAQDRPGKVPTPLGRAARTIPDAENREARAVLQIVDVHRNLASQR